MTLPRLPAHRIPVCYTHTDDAVQDFIEYMVWRTDLDPWEILTMAKEQFGLMACYDVAIVRH